MRKVFAWLLVMLLFTCCPMAMAEEGIFAPGTYTKEVTGYNAPFTVQVTVTIHAKNVILATGGFGSNIEMRQSVNTGVWADVELDSGIGCSNIYPCAQGDGLVMAQAVARP